MSWSTDQSREEEQENQRASLHEDHRRPPGHPPLRATFGNNAVALAPAVFVAGVVGAFTASVGSTLQGLGAMILTGIGVAVKEHLDKRAERRAEAERENYMPPTTDAGVGAIQQAHVVLASVMATINDIDGQCEKIHDGIDSRRQQLAGELGGGSQIPAELTNTYELQNKARDLVKEAHLALRAAETSLVNFDIRVLRSG